METMFNITMDTGENATMVVPVETTVYNIENDYKTPELLDMYGPYTFFLKSKILWYVLGMPMNILAFLVWLQPQMRHSSGCYLAALAVNDFLFLVLNMLQYLEVQHHPIICPILTVLYYTVNYPSTLLILAFTIEQYIAICFPMKRGQYCHSSTAIRLIIVIFLFSLALSSVQGYFFYYNEEVKFCYIRDEVVSVPENGVSLWIVWSSTTEILVFLITPIVILVLNILVIKSIKLQNKRMSMYRSSDSSQHRTTTIMLLVVSFYWIFTTLPSSILYTINNLYNPDYSLRLEEIKVDPEWQQYINYHVTRRVIDTICMSRFALNFCLYCITGRLFRKQLRRLFCCCGLKACDSTSSLNTCYEEHSMYDGKASVYRRNSNGVLLPKRGLSTRSGLSANSLDPGWTRARANSDIAQMALFRNNNHNGHIKVKLSPMKDGSL